MVLNFHFEKKRRKRERYLLFITFFLAFVILLAIGLYCYRNDILKAFVEEKIEKYELQNLVKIEYGRIYLQGISNLEVDDLYLIPANGDTLIYVKKIEADLDLWKLLCQYPEFDNLKIDGLFLFLKDKEGTRNFDFLLKHGNSLGVKSSFSSNYVKKTSQLLLLFFRFLPDDISISEMNVFVQSKHFFSRLYLPELKIRDNHFCSQLLVKEQDKMQYFILDGSFHHKNKSLECKVYTVSGEAVEIPYLQYKYSTRVSFDTLQFDFRPSNITDDLLKINGSLSFSGLNVLNNKLSEKEILFNQTAVDYQLNIHPDYVELDSSTNIWFNHFDFHPYVKIKPIPEPHILVSIHKAEFPSEDLFSSLPTGLFQNLQGIKTSGNLSYDFYFEVDMANVDSLKFHSALSKKGFRIVKFGETNFSEMNAPFLYHAYEDGMLVKSFEVGEANPNFRKLDTISPYLKAAVLFAEDGNFYYHTGFIEEALRSSFIKNIKEKRFARGGSTISMQLVKNVYLSRNKTLVRKLEEALIVWLIENNHLVNKDRMFEVYLNIIEWGPMIYGVNEASNFYFSKDASELTPEEAVFMASIIPKPKKFMWSFDQDRNLKPYLSGFYQIVGKRMLDHNYLSESQFDDLTPKVNISGAASAYLAKIEEERAEDEVEEWNIFQKTKSFLKNLGRKKQDEVIQNSSDKRN